MVRALRVSQRVGESSWDELSGCVRESVRDFDIKFIISTGRDSGHGREVQAAGRLLGGRGYEALPKWDDPLQQRD